MKNFFKTMVLGAAIMLLLAGCNDLLNHFNDPNSVVPEGSIKITVVNDADSFRTLVPGTPQWTKYVLEFNGPQGASRDPITLNPSSTTGGGSSTLVEGLTQGQWIITAKGYVLFNGQEVEAAMGTQQVTIPQGGGSSTSQNITVRISPNIAQGQPNGSFSYFVNIASDVTVQQASLTLSPFYIDGSGSASSFAVNNQNLRNQPSGQNSVSPGYYMLTVRVTDSNDITAVRREIVHIYSNMDTNAGQLYFDSNDFGVENDDPPYHIIQANPRGGSYSQPLYVQLETTVPGGNIFYSLSSDGGTGSNLQLYAGNPIYIGYGVTYLYAHVVDSDNQTVVSLNEYYNVFESQNPKGKSITIIDFNTGMGQSVQLYLLDGASPFESFEWNEVPRGSASISADGKAEFTLHTMIPIAGEENSWTSMPWDGTGSYWVMLEFNSNEKYLYTNGQTVNVNNPINNPKINIRDDATTVRFNLFREVPFGAGGQTLTITGLSGYFGAKIEATVLDFEQLLTGNDDAMFVAEGFAMVGTTGNTTVTLANSNNTTQGWSGTGEYWLVLGIETADGEYKAYMYTADANINLMFDFEEVDGDLIERLMSAPKFGFTGNSSTVNFGTFRETNIFGKGSGGSNDPELPVEYYPITVKAGNGGRITTNPQGNAPANTTVTFYATPDPGYTLSDISVTSITTNEYGYTTTTSINYEQASGTSGGGYFFIMPDAEVTISVSFTGGTTGGE